jgi:hypothetical protein
MLEPLPFVPYPYVLLPDENLSYEPILYVAPDRIICNGDVTFKTKHYPLQKVLSDKFKEDWSQEMADEMARRVIKQAKGYLVTRDLWLTAFNLPDFVFSAMEQAYSGKTPITGRNVTYGWPSGKITRITRILYGYTIGLESCVLYVRHEEAALPGKVHHQLQFPIHQNFLTY